MPTQTLIPDVSRDRILELSEKIKPVMRFARGEKGWFRSENGYLFYVEPVDPIRSSYRYLSTHPVSKAKGLELIHEFKTYHHAYTAASFEPTAAEVLAQIPEAYLDKVVAFEVLDCEGSDGSYDFTTTRLYAKKSKK